SPAEVLLHRIAVVEGERTTELVRGLNDTGLAAHPISAGKLHTLIAGLVVFEEHTEPSVMAEALRLLRRRQTPVGALVLAGDDARMASERLEVADAALPASSPLPLIVAQLRALARLLATEPPMGEPEVITVRDLTIDLEHREVRTGGRSIELTPTEFLILALLARRRGVVSHADIFREIHGDEIANERDVKNMVKVHMWRLRAKLAEALPGRDVVINVRGFGYLLERRLRPSG
ncbi:MAG: winged helix-turn-helix domain-containing protein, partial [Dehalococcoidia bacterium]